MQCHIVVGIVLGLALSAEAHPNPFGAYSYYQTKIVGGKEAEPHQFPYQVGLNLFLENGKVSFCGGSLITNQYILTAAHCTDKVQKMEVVLGAHNVNNAREVTQVRMNTSIIIPHEKWHPTLVLNDIALVKLPKKITLKSIHNSEYVNNIYLPDSETTDYAGETATVSGWGKTSDDVNVMTDKLQFVDSEVIGAQECQKMYPLIIHDTHLCISTKGGKSSCNGDSGGPLVVEHNGSPLQIGIVSFGYHTCETNHPAIFTRVSKYLDWIKKNVAI